MWARSNASRALDRRLKLEQADLKALRPLETGNITSQARNCCLGNKVGQHKDKEKWEDIPRPTSSRAPIS